MRARLGWLTAGAGLAAAAYAASAEPGHVKIAWTLRADPDGPSSSIFRSETRALATDRPARARFRLYWSCLSAGIILIRRLMLRPVKAEAERRAAAMGARTRDSGP